MSTNIRLPFQQDVTEKPGKMSRAWAAALNQIVDAIQPFTIFLPAGTLLGRGTGSIGQPQSITLGSGLSMVGTVLSAAGSGGTVTTTGSPIAGELTQFSGATSITNGNLSGDVTTSGSLATTLSSTGVSASTYGDATHVGQFTVDVKGRLTSASNVAITFPAPATDFVPSLMLMGG